MTAVRPVWAAEACGHVAIALLTFAAVAQVPDVLTGLGERRHWLFVVYFVGAVWASAFLIPSVLRLSLAVSASALVWAVAMRLAIGAYGLKETAIGLQPLGSDGGLFELLAFLGSALLLAIPLLMKRQALTPNLLHVSCALLISLAALAAVDVAVSLAGHSQFMDPLDITFFSYLFPLMASAIAVLGWRFVKYLPSMKGPTRGES